MAERFHPPPPTQVANKSPYMELHGPWLRRFRKHAELEVDELATTAGITAAYLRQLELGFRPRTSVKVYRALRDALGLSSEDGVYLLGSPWNSSALDDATPPTEDTNGDAA